MSLALHAIYALRADLVEMGASKFSLKSENGGEQICLEMDEPVPVQEISY